MLYDERWVEDADGGGAEEIVVLYAANVCQRNMRKGVARYAKQRIYV